MTGKWDVFKILRDKAGVLPGLVDELIPWLQGRRKELNIGLHEHSVFPRKGQANKKSSLLLPIFVF